MITMVSNTVRVISNFTTFHKNNIVSMCFYWSLEVVKNTIKILYNCIQLRIHGICKISNISFSIFFCFGEKLLDSTQRNIPLINTPCDQSLILKRRLGIKNGVEREEETRPKVYNILFQWFLNWAIDFLNHF